MYDCKLQSRYTCILTLRYVRYARITLIVSIETYKEVNSTSFNLKQEVFISRDEDWPEEDCIFCKRDLPRCQVPLTIYATLFRSIFISPDEDLLFEVETSWVNFFVSFNADDQSNSCVSNVSKYTVKSSRWTFSIHFDPVLLK